MSREIEGATDAFNVAGRGEMQPVHPHRDHAPRGLRVPGVARPVCCTRSIDGKKCEPIERLVVDVPSDCVGAVIEKLGSRKADMLEMTPVGSRMKIEFLVPARGLFGYRNEFLTDTRGEGIMASVFDSYAPYKGDMSRRNTGSLVSFETGESRDLRPVQRPGARHAVHRRRACRCTRAWSWASTPSRRTSPSTSARRSS